MPRRGAPGLLKCVLPDTCVGALGIGENTGLHWLREVQGGQFGRGGDVDGMPRLGDDVGPGSDLRLKVTQDVVTGEGACVPDREQQAVLVGEIVVMGRNLALLTGPDPGGGLYEQPLGCCQGCRGPLIRGHRGEAGGRPDLPSPEGSGVSLAGKADVIAQLGLDRQARFLVGDLAATGLPDASCDAVISLDVLPFVPDKAAAAREVARILRPGGRFAFTTWERLGHPAGDDPQRRELAGTFQDHPLLESAKADYRQLISQAGLSIETYREPPAWRCQQQALAEGIIAAEAQVAGDMGRHYPAMAQVFLASLPDSRYILVTARRPADTHGQHDPASSGEPKDPVRP
jgi:Methyltransferase domain